MTDFSHLNAIELRLSHEKARLGALELGVAQGGRIQWGELAMRRVWIAQIEKELAAERAFLGLAAGPAIEEMSNDELLAELTA